MEQTTAAGRVVRFGRFELDLQSLELRKGGARVRIQEQPLQLLLLMVERPGEVLTREDLRQRLWPNGTYVDFEHGLNAAVKRLRNVLGDVAENPRYVETMHRRGYRFIVSVERLGSSERDTSRDLSVNATALIGRGDRSQGHPRLVVLPFANLGDAPHDYFGDGLTGEIIAQVGRLCARHVGVIARASSAAAGESGRTIGQIRQALGVDYVLEGAVRRDGDRVRITAQLVETRGETQLWADTYERRLADALTVQADVALSIAHALVGELAFFEVPSLSGVSRNPVAHQAYLKGLFYWNKPADEGIARAIDYFEQAIATDATFGSAHAALARALVSMADYYGREPRAALEAARAAALRALELDAQNGVARVALASVRQALDWDLQGAEIAYVAAMAGNPSNEAAYRRYALLLAARSQFAEASAAVQRACELDPVCLVANTSAALVRFYARDYGRALEWCRHTLEMEPCYQPARRLLAAILVLTGRSDEAIRELAQTSVRRMDAVSLTWLAHALAVRGRLASARRVLHHAVARGDSFVPAYHQAIAYVGMGDADAAVAMLTRACEERDPAIVNLAAEPRFDALRPDPRFAAIVDRIGLGARQALGAPPAAEPAG